MLALTLLACGWTPTASLGGLDVTRIDPVGADAALTLQVHDPWPVGASGSGDWRVQVGQTPLASGVLDTWTLAPGHSEVVVPLSWRWVDLWAACGGKGHDAPYVVEVTLRGEQPFPWTLPLRHEGVLPGISLPSFQLVDVVLDELSLQRIAATVRVSLDVPVERLGWAVRVGAVPLLHGEVHRAEGLLRLPVALELGRAGEALLTAWQLGGAVTLDGELSTPFGPLPVAWEGRW